MQQNIYNITEKDIDEKKKIISKNYASIYYNLLPDEGPNPPARQPIEIGNKDVYALSDIEGYNIDFLEMLRKLGLVEYKFDCPNENCIEETKCCEFDKWRHIRSLTKDNGKADVYYKFNEEKCRNFNDVIVLCGDYVRSDRDVSEGTVRILEELHGLLNGGKTEENKGLYLLAGNHDIANYDPVVEGAQRDLKTKVLNLGLYPQLLLQNGDGKKLLFQHTNFPYLEYGNFIVNKKIDLSRAIELLENNYPWDKRMLWGNGFFHLRYQAPKGAKQPNYYTCGTKHDPNSKLLRREIYSDFGIGYDAKFIGHDAIFYGCSMRPDGRGDVYNVNICNQNKPSFVCWRSNQKQRPLQSNVQANYNNMGNIYMNYAIQNKEYKKNLYNLLYNKLLEAKPI